jgi:predicted SAM-dependent methyltransferase
VDLSRRWPWADSSVTYIRAWDIIEHLPDKIHTMNEAHRVLVPGGIIEIKVPTTDGPGAWQDPQHCSFWNRNSFWYFTRGVAEYERFHEAYGITACFEVVSDVKKVWQSGVVDLTIVMRAVK